MPSAFEDGSNKGNIMKVMNIAKKYGAKLAILTPMALAVQAHAALPDGVETAIQTGFTDANKVAGMVLAGLAVIFGILLARRLLR